MSKRLEKLERALADMKASNRSIWDIYGSELCAGEMMKEEERLQKEIDKIKKEEKIQAQNKKEERLQKEIDKIKKEEKIQAQNNEVLNQDISYITIVYRCDKCGYISEFNYVGNFTDKMRRSFKCVNCEASWILQTIIYQK